MTPYNHLVGYLHRWTICKLGRLHIRVHHILSADGTPFLHSHPFDYISIVLKGGYTEQVLDGDTLRTIEHRAPAVIIRPSATCHRISAVHGACKTLFLAWARGPWALRRHPDIQAPDSYRTPAKPGLYRRHLNGRRVWSKFENGEWYAGDPSPDVARGSTALSVHQATEWEAGAGGSSDQPARQGD